MPGVPNELVERFRGFRARFSQSRRSIGRTTHVPRPCELRAFDTSLRAYTRQPKCGEPDYGLCDRCNSIDFLAIFCVDPTSSKAEGDLTKRPWWSAKLLDITMPFEREDLPVCPLCKVFHACAGDYDPESDFNWELCLGQISSPESRSLSRNPIVLCFQSKFFHKRISLLVPIHWPVHQPLLTPAIAPRTEYLLSQSVPYPMFAMEIQRCVDIEARQKRHGARRRFPKGMKVIDCWQRRVVDYDGHADYLTLSYVWGRQSQLATTINANDESRISTSAATITDAVTVTLSLGKKYLWIDRYCIDQQEPMKSSQINNMSDIFVRSWATIVSLGPDADTNLPGVSIGRERPQLVRTSQCDILGPSERPDSCISNSIWNTRAWTFQEGVLSRRLLFFADYEVFLMCDHGVVFESRTGMSHADSSDSVGTFLEHSHPSMREPPRDEIFRPERMLGTIEEYCSRDLSYETDSFNAFQGYLKDSDLDSLWGVISPYPEHHRSLHRQNIHYLDNGICGGMLWCKPPAEFQSTSAPRGLNQPPYLCDKFPSWSWISCRRHTRVSRIPYPDLGSLWIASAFLDDHNGKVDRLSAVLGTEQASLNSDSSPLIVRRSKQILVQGRFLQLDLDDQRPLIQRLQSAWIELLAIPKMTTSVQFCPDLRTCCSRHQNWETEEACDAVLLLHVDSFGSKPVGTTTWLALREETRDLIVDDSHRYWHRVGLITVFFYVRPPRWRSTIPPEEYEADASELTAARTKFKKAIMQDIRAEGNLRMTRLG